MILQSPGMLEARDALTYLWLVGMEEWGTITTTTVYGQNPA